MKLRPLDYAERNGYVRGVVRDLIHDPGRGAPIVKVQFNNPYKYKKDNYQWTATEGTYTGQFIYCGKKGTLSAPTCPLSRHRTRTLQSVVHGGLPAADPPPSTPFPPRLTAHRFAACFRSQPS